MFSAEKSFLLTPAGTRSGLRYTGGHTLPCFTAVPPLLLLLQPCLALEFGEGEPAARPGIVSVVYQGSSDLCAAHMLSARREIRPVSVLGRRMWTKGLLDKRTSDTTGLQVFHGSRCQLDWQVKEEQEGK